MRRDVLRDHPIFICGHPKSGTSLMRNLLDHHPQLAVYPEESHFFRNFLPRAAGLSLEQMIALGEEKLLHIFEWNLENPPDHQTGFLDRDYSFISFEEVRRKFGELLRAEGIRHPGDVLWAAAQTFSQVSGGQVEKQVGWVEKTPSNEYYAPRIFAWWPEARCIHIVRDPRDNYASYQQKQGSWSAGKFSAHWNRSTAAGCLNEADYGDDRYWLLRYEDLVTEPEKTLGQICQFLGIEDHPTLRKPTRVGDLWRGNSMFAAEFQGISSAAVGRWKEQLPASQAGVVQTASRQYIKRFNYQDVIPVSFRDRLTGWYWRLRGQFYDLRNGLRRKA